MRIRFLWNLAPSGHFSLHYNFFEISTSELRKGDNFYIDREILVNSVCTLREKPTLKKFEIVELWEFDPLL